METKKTNIGKVSIVPKGKYNASKQYERLDVVESNGSTYIAIVDNIGKPVTNTSYWYLLVSKGDKGDTYEVTDADLAEIEKRITDDANSIFNTNVREKTEEFNTNALTKKEDVTSTGNKAIGDINNLVNEFTELADTAMENFDDLVDTQTKSFNTNVTNKTTEFNDNSINKTSDFNKNVIEKTNEFNSNATTKTQQFDANANTQTRTFDDNALDKLNAYNQNTEGKIEAYNQNVEEKTEEFNQLANVERITALEQENIEQQHQIDNLYRASDINTVTSENEEVHIDNAKPVDMYRGSFDGKTEQETTEGYNLLKFPYPVDSRELNGVVFKYLSDGGVNINGTATAISNFYLENYNLSLEEGSYTQILLSSDKKTLNNISGVRIQTRSDSISIGFPMIMDLNNGTLEKRADDFYVRIQVSAGTTFNDVTVYPMLVKGAYEKTNYPSYEPYTGGIASPNPDYPQEIVNMKGYNLLDLSKYPINKSNSTLNGGSYIVEDGILKIDGTNATAIMTIKSDSVSEENKIILSKGTYYFGVNVNGKYNNTGSNVQFTKGIVTLTDDYYISQWYVTCKVSEKSDYNLIISLNNKYNYAPPKSVAVRTQTKNIVKKWSNNSTTTKDQASIYVEAELKPDTYYVMSFKDKSVGNNYYRNEHITNNYKIFSFTADGNRQTYYFKTLADLNKNSQNYVDGKGYIIFKNNDAQANAPQFGDVQIEEVTSFDDLPSAYIPYQENHTFIDLQDNELCKVGDVADKLIIDYKGNCAIEKNIYKLFLNTINWYLFNTSGNYPLFATSIINNYKYSNDYAIKSNAYIGIQGVSGSAGINKYNFKMAFRVNQSDNVKSLYISDNRFNNAEDFNNYMINSDIYIQYPLKTPEYITLPKVKPLQLLRGINYVTVESNLGSTEMEIEYVEDLHKYIDEIKQAVVALGSIE